MHQTEGCTDIQRTWQPDDVVELRFDMPVRRVRAHEKLEDTRGKIALERGPLVCCVEGLEIEDNVLELTLSNDQPLGVETQADVLDDITWISGNNFKAISYYAWDQHSVSPMTVWLRRSSER